MASLNIEETLRQTEEGFRLFLEGVKDCAQHFSIFYPIFPR